MKKRVVKKSSSKSRSHAIFMAVILIIGMIILANLAVIAFFTINGKNLSLFNILEVKPEVINTQEVIKGEDPVENKKIVLTESLQTNPPIYWQTYHDSFYGLSVHYPDDWGLVPFFIPKEMLPLLGLNFTDFQVMLLRVWGVIVFLDFFVYWYIYKKPHSKWTKYLLLFATVDNGGVGLVLLILTPLLSLPWGIWINIPFQLFFGYWFWRFYKEGFSKSD